MKQNTSLLVVSLKAIGVKTATLLLASMMMSNAIACEERDGYQYLVDMDTKLNIVYQQVIGKYKQNTRFINDLRSTQRLWLQFRDAEVKANFPTLNDKQLHGNDYSEEVATSLANLTVERVIELNQWLSNGTNSCPIINESHNATNNTNADFLTDGDVNLDKLIRLQKPHSRITGTYGDEFNSVQLLELEDNRVFFDFDLMNSVNNHLGNLEGFVNKNRMIYQSHEFAGLCKFKISHANKEITIETLDNGWMCGYGQGVYSDGTFALKSKQLTDLSGLWQADNQLNNTYKGIMAQQKANPVVTKRLRNAQRLWIKLRDAKVKTHAFKDDSLCKSAYLAELTRQRKAKLEQYLSD